MKEEIKKEVVAPVAEEPETEVKEEALSTVDLTKGEEIYKKSCFACHDGAVAGAAKLDNKERWEISAAKGFETLNSNAIIGFTGDYGTMPAKGGIASITDEDIVNAVAFMINKAGVIAE